MFEHKMPNDQTGIGVHVTTARGDAFPRTLIERELEENFKEVKIVMYSEISESAYNQKMILFSRK